MANDAILKLSPLKWRDIALWCSAIETNYSHRQVERQYPYVNVPGHDHTGFNGFQVTATLHFLNTIEPGMYPDKWLTFRDAIIDGTSGPLDHPDVGEITAVPMDGSFRITAQSTAGIIVTASWAQSRDTVDEAIDFGTPGGQSEENAAAADEALAELELEYPDGEPDTSLGDTVAGIEGAVFSLGQQLGGAINQAQGLVARHINALDLIGSAYRFADPATRDANAGNPARAVAETTVFGTYASLGQKAQQAAKKARPTGVYLVTAPTSLASLASTLSNKLDELIELNSSLASSPTVPASTKVVHYVSK